MNEIKEMVGTLTAKIDDGVENKTTNVRLHRLAIGKGWYMSGSFGGTAAILFTCPEVSENEVENKFLFPADYTVLPPDPEWKVKFSEESENYKITTANITLTFRNDFSYVKGSFHMNTESGKKITGNFDIHNR